MKALIIGNNSKIGQAMSLLGYDVSLFLRFDFDDWGNRKNSDLEKFYLIKDTINLKKNKLRIRKKIILQLLTDSSYDVIITNTKIDLFATSWAIKKIKSNSILLSIFHNSYAWINKINVFILIQLIKRTCANVIALSKVVHENFIKYGFDSKRVAYITNGIEATDFIPKTSYVLSSPITVCYCGVLADKKNQLFLIDAVNQLSLKYDISVHFFGNLTYPDYKSKLYSRISELNFEKKVFFHGSVPNEFLKRNLCQFDIYVSCSRLEMSPYNILEAKSAGLPIIASNVMGQNELLYSDDGLLYEPDNLDELVSKIDLVLSNFDFRERIGKKARESSLSRNSIYSMSNKINCFIKEIQKCQKRR